MRRVSVAKVPDIVSGELRGVDCLPLRRKRMLIAAVASVIGGDE